mmetsp:Transcript_20454/g.24561  ORF Transcript_20454/g.24561 Transcript_20454/m.24561 type:complete len:237 (-) Transcript_20454:183-893(-)
MLECAEAIYNNIGMIGEPGKVYSYNSYHLQIAGALAVQATGLGIQDVLDKYLYKAYGMNETVCAGSNPQLAVCMLTTGHDYGQFLNGVLSNNPLSKEITDASEVDSTPFMADYYTLYGDYGFGHFLFCFDSIFGFTEECKEAKVHCDPGAFGFIPWIDRKNEYYAQIVAYETGGFYGRSGIPEYIIGLIKPVIDAIINEVPYVSELAGHHTPSFNGLGMADLNYIQNCYVNPKQCL